MKQWGDREFWGIGSEFDLDFLLTDEQKQLRNKVMEICRTKIRPQAIENDQNYNYPRESINALAELGLLGLIIPKKFGGMGQNHLCCAVIVETIARYGCPSTAMIYTMHNLSLSILLFRHHKSNHIQTLLRRVTSEKLLGAVIGSDPATGSHDWYPLSSKARYLDANSVQLLRFGSWCTSAGYADFYCTSTISPQYKDKYSKQSYLLVYKDEVRATTDEWNALGMHANQAGPILVEGTFSTDRIIGEPTDGQKILEEAIEIYFLLLTSCCWCGIALASIDLARRHVTRAAHADVGMTVADYPVIQDYIGESIIDTNATRSMGFMLAQTLDSTTDNNNWEIHSDPNCTPRTKNIHWLWKLKFSAAKNVATVTERMLRACGGEGYKTNLGLERLYRDGKAGWVMAPSNEVLRNLIGNVALKGFESIDLWEERSNESVVQREVKKMTATQKEALGKRLLEEAKKEKEGKTEDEPGSDYQDTDFLNPFNTAPPATNSQSLKGNDGIVHDAALKVENWTPLTLTNKQDLTSITSAFTFALPNPTDHTGCLPGQYIAVRVKIADKEHIRYFSPVSRPDEFGKLEVVLRYETQGVVSTFFKDMNIGDKVEFQGPCGGLEYTENCLDEVTVLAGGGGVTPGIQLIRCLHNNTNDKTKYTLIYYANTPKDIMFKDELDKYAAKDSRIRVVYSVGEGGEGWSGEEGFIDNKLLDKYITKPNGTKHKIVICGGPRMSISTIFSLQQLGFSPQTIFIYGQFGVEQVKAVYGKQTSLASHTCY